MSHNTKKSTGRNLSSSSQEPKSCYIIGSPIRFNFDAGVQKITKKDIEHNLKQGKKVKLIINETREFIDRYANYLIGSGRGKFLPVVEIHLSPDSEYLPPHQHRTFQEQKVPIARPALPYADDVLVDVAPATLFEPNRPNIDPDFQLQALIKTVSIDSSQFHLALADFKITNIAFQCSRDLIVRTDIDEQPDVFFIGHNPKYAVTKSPLPRRHPISFFRAFNPTAKQSGIRRPSWTVDEKLQSAEIIDRTVSENICAFRRQGYFASTFNILTGTHYTGLMGYDDGPGAKGVLDYLIFPLIARQIIFKSLDSNNYLTKILGCIVGISLEIVRFSAAIALTIVIAPIIAAIDTLVPAGKTDDVIAMSKTF